MEYRCKICGVLFESQEWARKCAEWCSEHKSCNIEVMKHAK